METAMYLAVCHMTKELLGYCAHSHYCIAMHAYLVTVNCVYSIVYNCHCITII